jgi:PAS domain S-box-containing protein
MSAAPLPPNERERLDVLGRYAILDTLPQQQYDDLTFLAAQICGAPISLISLVDKDRQWFKSRYGIEAVQTTRELSFCAHTILGNEILEVPDATRDARFADNDAVLNDPLIRFYAGAPLITPDGYKLGTLCVVDHVPRRLTDNQKHALEGLARQTMSQMEVWRNIRQLEVANGERSIALQVAQQTTDRLTESEARFRQFMDNSPAMAFIKDEYGNYVYFNAPMAQSFDISLGDLTGKNDYDWLPHDVAKAVRANDAQVLQSRQTLRTIEEVPTPDGKAREWLVFKFPIAEATGTCYLGGVALDITEQRRVEKLKSEFVSMVSHELRTPLTSIRGALGLLAGGAAGVLPDAASQMIGIAQKNSERLVLLINDILDIEKIESDKMRFDLRLLNLREVLQSAVESNAAYGEALDVKLRLDWDESDDSLRHLQVMGDEHRLQQVLSNLLSNGAKWTPAGGNVYVKAQVMETSTEKEADESASAAETKFPDARVRVFVQDEGPGVPEDFVGQLFERFAQADASTTRRQGGTGLGLAIARAIVEKHGGVLDYIRPADRDASQSATGALFSFDLPVQRANIAEETKSVDSQNALPRILICEDEPEVAELLRFMITHSGYETDVVSTLSAARVSLENGDYEGMTLDLMLPDGDGLDFLAQLRESESEKLRDLPVVVVSLHSEAGKMHGQALGVIDWLRKPIDSRRLVASLEQLRGPETPRVLHIEDDPDVRRVMAAIIGDGAKVIEAASLREAREQLERARNGGQSFQLAILDVGLPDGSGLELLPLFSACDPVVPVVLFSASEPSQEQTRMVAASLTKSLTTNEVLRKTIANFLGKLA